MMTILTVFGYLILFLLAWVAVYVLAFTASRAWCDGRTQAEKQVTQEIQRWDASLNSSEIPRHLSENTDRDKRILDVTNTLLGVTSEMNRAVGHLLQMEKERLEKLEGNEPPPPPTSVS